jgi:hypothetical protein
MHAIVVALALTLALALPCAARRARNATHRAVKPVIAPIARAMPARTPLHETSQWLIRAVLRPRGPLSVYAPAAAFDDTCTHRLQVCLAPPGIERLAVKNAPFRSRGRTLDVFGGQEDTTNGPGRFGRKAAGRVASRAERGRDSVWVAGAGLCRTCPSHRSTAPRAMRSPRGGCGRRKDSKTIIDKKNYFKRNYSRYL